MVDTISKPFTFTPNTYARANEVNSNFDTLYTGVNSCANQINTNVNDIAVLESSKANIRGSSTQPFAVANPINDYDSINKQTMFKYLQNSLDYISGFKISKSTSSPSDTIVVSEGSCFDSNRTTIIKSTSPITKQNTNQGANTTYYVYVIATDGGSCDVSISSSNTEPVLPTGYTLYRMIGSYTTDSNGSIQYITSGDGFSPEIDSYIIEHYKSGRSGYILYSSNLLIQWFTVNNNSNTTITANLLKGYGNTNYIPVGSDVNAQAGAVYPPSIMSLNNNNFTFYLSHNTSAVTRVQFIVMGYVS